MQTAIYCGVDVSVLLKYYCYYLDASSRAELLSVLFKSFSYQRIKFVVLLWRGCIRTVQHFKWK